MRLLRRSWLVMLVLAAGVFAEDAPKSAAMRDPWVFRCVLDERARVIVAQLQPTVWVAYDAQSCGVYKAWLGEIKLTGAVYDTKHGPQPLSVGDHCFQQESLELWSITKNGQNSPAKAKYLGYRLSKEPRTVTFMYRIETSDGKAIDIEETPSAKETQDKPQTLTRDLTFKNIPANTTVSLVLAGAAVPDQAKWTTSAGKVEDDHLLVSSDGPVTLTLPLIAPHNSIAPDKSNEKKD